MIHCQGRHLERRKRLGQFGIVFGQIQLTTARIISCWIEGPKLGG